MRQKLLEANPKLASAHVQFSTLYKTDPSQYSAKEFLGDERKVAYMRKVFLIHDALQ